MRPYCTAPMFVTDKPAETRAFWVETLGLRIAFDHAAYLGLRVGPSGAPEIGFITADDERPEPVAGGDHDHETNPPTPRVTSSTHGRRVLMRTGAHGQRSRGRSSPRAI